MSPVFCGQFCFLRPILNGLGFVLVVVVVVARPLTVMVRSTTTPWHPQSTPKGRGFDSRSSVAAFCFFLEVFFDFGQSFGEVLNLLKIWVRCFKSRPSASLQYLTGNSFFFLILKWFFLTSQPFAQSGKSQAHSLSRPEDWHQLLCFFFASFGAG